MPGNKSSRRTAAAGADQCPRSSRGGTSVHIILMALCCGIYNYNLARGIYSNNNKVRGYRIALSVVSQSEYCPSPQFSHRSLSYYSYEKNRAVVDRVTTNCKHSITM